MKNCRMCGKELTGRQFSLCSSDCAVARHKEYIENLKHTGGECERCSADCGKRQKYCHICLKLVRAEKSRALNKGKKQSEEQIRKRVQNTDQAKKEQKRKQTMVERHGVDNPSQLDTSRQKQSERTKGVPRPRTKEWQQKIIDSKIKNGTTKHSQETKKKLSKGMMEAFKNGTRVSVPVNSYGRNKHGKVGDCHFRSSYEEIFLLFCEKYGIKVESAECKEMAVIYKDRDGKTRRYYPDFYLPEYDTTVEIKPITMLDIGNNPYKIDAGLTSITNYVILTEADDFFDERTWDEMYNEMQYWRPVYPLAVY